MTHTISSNVSIICLFGLLLAYQTTAVVSASHSLSQTSSTSAGTSSTIRTPPERRTLTRGALGAKSASRDDAPLDQERELGIATMVSSVFDAMEAVGVAGNGMNRLINRAGGATGPDDELVDTGPEDELVNTSPEDELVNRGGGAAAASTAEDWYGKGKGKGKSGIKSHKVGKIGCRGKSGGKSGGKSVGKSGRPTSSHSSGKGKGSKPKGAKASTVGCSDVESYPSWEEPYPSWEHPHPSWEDPYPSWEDPHPSWEDPYPSWEAPYPSWEDPVREESPDVPPIDGGDPTSGGLPVQESKDDEDDTLQPVCGRDADGKMCPAGQCCSGGGHCGNGAMHCGEGCQSGNCDHCYREDSHNDMVSQPVCGRDAGGKMCPDGQCCSKFGFCGPDGPAYCGEGCQSGNCDSEGSHNGMPDESGVHDAPTCGEQAGGAMCPDGQCCSKFGYCGPDGPAYCGEGCQSGNCYPEGSHNDMPTDESGVHDAPTCGKQVGGAMCPDGQCCSKFGYCGVDESYCSSGCQSGNCYPEGSHNDMTSQPVCGREAGGAMCPDGQCCSKFGFCSDGPEFCGSGCQSGKCYHCYPEGSHHEMPTDESGVYDAPTCGKQAGGAKCPDGLCCSLDGWCGDGEAYCGIGCQSGNCLDLFGNQELSKDDTEGEDAGHDDNTMPIGSSGFCLTDTTTGEKYCDDPSHCCSKYNYCGLGDDENYCGENCVGGACWASGVTNEETNAPATGTTDKELGHSNIDTTGKEHSDGEPKEMHHGTGYGSGIGMYAICLGRNESISNDDLEDSVSNEVIVNYQYALNTDEDADLDEVLTLLEYQVHNLLLLEKMDCSLAGRRKLQAGCYPEAIVSSPREVEITDTVCQESEGIEGTKCHVIDGGFGVFLGTNPECGLFAEDDIRQDYLAWIRDKMTKESRSGLSPAIETVDGAAGISFRGAIMPDNRAPVISTGAISGFQTQDTGEDVSSEGITALGGFLIGFISAGIAAIAFLVARRRNKKDYPDEQPILQDDKDLRDLEQDMGDTSSDEGTITALSAGAVDHLQIRDNKTIIPFGNVGEAEIGDDIDSRVGAEPLSFVVEDANLFDRSLQSQEDETNSTPTLTRKTHFCDSPLCEACCGTVATPQDAGCCMISSPCARNNADMEERPYTTPDTVEF